MAYSLAGILLNDGNSILQSENMVKAPQLTPLPVPLADSTSTDTFDFGGVIRTITIDGVYVGTQAEINTFMESIEDIANGNQATTIAFVSDVRGTFNVKIDNVDSTYSAGRSRQIAYTIRLIESSSRG